MKLASGFEEGPLSLVRFASHLILSEGAPDDDRRRNSEPCCATACSSIARSLRRCSALRACERQSAPESLFTNTDRRARTVDHFCQYFPSLR